jgi:hypothetical protein
MRTKWMYFSPWVDVLKKQAAITIVEYTLTGIEMVHGHT